MKNTRRIRKTCYTLLEIISAMAVFMIICLVVIRFFNGAQQLVSTSNSSNEMYADVRAFFDIIGSDLQSVVYNNQVSKSGTYPFVNSYYPIDGSSGPFQDYYNNIEKFYDHSLIPPGLHSELALKDKSGSNLSRDYVPLLCFMSNSAVSPANKISPLCEVRYTFTPVGTHGNTKAKFTYRDISSSSYLTERLNAPEFFGGRIYRSLTYADPGKNDSNTNTTSTRHPHDADTFPMVDQTGTAVSEGTGSDKNRTQLVFGDKSSFKYEELITNVYRMNITCFKLELMNSGGNKVYRYAKLGMYDMINASGDGASIGTGPKKEFYDDYASYLEWPPLTDPTTPFNPITNKYKYRYPVDDSNIQILQLGHPLPDIIKIDLYLLSSKDWNLLMSYYDWNDSKFNDENAARKLLERKLKHFSRTFYINNVDVSNL